MNSNHGENRQSYSGEKRQNYIGVDSSLFGPNKHGERGKKNIVYRLLLGYETLFEVDENSRPKKFKLSSDNEQDDNSGVINFQKKYSFGESSVYINGKKYDELEFSLESDFEDEVKNNHKLIFGNNSHYYDIRKKIGNRICDAFVFDEDLNKVLVVENEIFIHDLWGHIIPQIIEFFNGMKEENTKMSLKYNVEWKEEHKLKILEAIDKNQFEIMVVIDKINFEIKKTRNDINELVKHFTRNSKIKIHFKEFKVFIDDKDEKIFMVQ